MAAGAGAFARDTGRRRPAGRIRADIQGLRAVAVGLVLLSHGGVPGIAGGYVGVDVFFVISGFLITGILVREIDRDGRVSIIDFYVRRARRILPAATVTLLAVLAVSAITLQSNRFAEIATHVRWAALFASNIDSARSGSDYFSEQAFVSPVQHFWSLAVEEQFYLVWPALIALLVRVVSRRRGVRWSAHRAILLALALLGAVSLIWSVHQTEAAPTSAYFSTLTRGWELGLGAALALAPERLFRFRPLLAAALTWVGLTAIASAAVFFNGATPFPGYAALLPTLGAALIIAGGQHAPDYGAERVLGLRPMRWLGDVSYSLYLWHWPILVLPALYVARELRLAERLILLAVAVGVAAMSYRWVESPLRRAPGPARRWGTLSWWPTSIALVMGFTLVAGTAASALTPHHAPAPTVHTASTPAREAVRLSAAAAQAQAALPHRLTPNFDDLMSDVAVLPTGCNASRSDARVRGCVYGDPQGAIDVAVVGDSHSTMWKPALEPIAQQRGWRVTAYMKAACFPTAALQWDEDSRRPYASCTQWQAGVLGDLARVRPDLILVTGHAGFSLANKAKNAALPQRQRNAELGAGITEFLSALDRITHNVIAVGATPILPATASDCLGVRTSTMATCAAPATEPVTATNKALRAAITSLRTKSAVGSEDIGPRYLDPLPWLCAEDLCPVVIGDTIAYRDADHLTISYVRTLADELDTALPHVLQARS